jgi:hypothetical protein
MNDTQIFPGEMLQRYIRLLAKYLHVFRNIVMAFLVPLQGNTNPSDCTKKCQQAFLASLPGKALVKRIF